MSDEKRKKKLYSLMSLEDFKAFMGIDDREDKLSKFCLKVATLAIENYCKRKFLKKKRLEYHTYIGENFFTLSEYPVRKILSVDNGGIVPRDLYYWTTADGISEETPTELVILPPLSKKPNSMSFKITYISGYSVENIPADIASACMELASWNMNRYRGKKIGMTSNVRGKGREGEHFEMSMPENVKALLEPYRRKTI